MMHECDGFPRISYTATNFYKRILPALILTVYGAVVLAIVQVTNDQNWQDSQKLLLGTTGIAIWAGLVWWFSFWRCCDEVWDAGSSLVFRKGTIEERIALTEVSEIRRSFAFRPERLTLCLRNSTRLGSRIHFLVPYRHVPWGPPPLFTSLAARIESAKK